MKLSEKVFDLISNNGYYKNTVVLELKEMKSFLKEHGIHLNYDEAHADSYLKSYDPNGASPGERIPVEFTDGEETFYMEASVWMDTNYWCQYAIVPYYPIYEYDVINADLVFRLGKEVAFTLSEKQYEEYMTIPVVKSRLGDIPYSIFQYLINKERSRGFK